MSAGGPKPSAFYLERQLLTRLPTTPAAPNFKSSNYAPGQNDPGVGNPTPGDGLVIANNMAVTVSMYANPGATFTSAGNLLAWIYNPYQALWTRCYELDLDCTFTGSGTNARTFAPFQIPSRLGVLMLWLASGVTVTGGGTDILVRQDGFNSVLGMTS